AALQMLPRNQQLHDDIFAAGILPDRSSPWRVEYTVPTNILQDADAKVRLEALLVLSELPASQRAAAAVADVFSHPENARDRWMPDAVAFAGIKQGVPFLAELLTRRVTTTDSATLAGMRRAVSMMSRHH